MNRATRFGSNPTPGDTSTGSSTRSVPRAAARDVTHQ